MTDPESSDLGFRVRIMLEEYRILAEDTRLFDQELIRCFLYLAGVAGVYLGWGSGNPQIRLYAPYALVLLVLYFLTLSTLKFNLSAGRSHLETRINQEMKGEPLLTWESLYVPRVQRIKVLRFHGDKWYNAAPSTPLIFGLVLAIAALALFGTSVAGPSRLLILVLFVVSGMLVIWVFFAYPKRIDRALSAINPERQTADEKQGVPSN